MIIDKINLDMSLFILFGIFAYNFIVPDRKIDEPVKKKNISTQTMSKYYDFSNFYNLHKQFKPLRILDKIKEDKNEKLSVYVKEIVSNIINISINNVVCNNIQNNLIKKYNFVPNYFVEQEYENSDEEPIIILDNSNWCVEKIKHIIDKKEISSFNDIFKIMKVSQFPILKTCVEVESDLSIRESLKILMRNQQRCAPIYKYIDENKQYIGMIDVIDSTLFILQDELFSLEDNVKKATNKFIMVKNNSKMKSVVNYLKNGNRHVCCTDGNKIKIISQTQLLEFINCIFQSSKSIKIQSIFKKSIISLNFLNNNELKYIKKNTSTRTAFKMMITHEITSLPIVHIDKNKLKITSVISMSDIKIFSRESLTNKDIKKMLSLDCIDFVQKSRQYVGEILNREIRNVNEVITCSINDSLEYVIEQMLHNNIHHIYIVNNECLVGVISFVDIINKILNLC